MKGSLLAAILLAATSTAFDFGTAVADEIVIGASLPLSGFGSFQRWGYKRATDEVRSTTRVAL